MGWRKALADRAMLRGVLQRAGAELVLHGHARDARLDALGGPQGPIPCLCVPSSSALPNPEDEGALAPVDAVADRRRPARRSCCLAMVAACPVFCWRWLLRSVSAATADDVRAAGRLSARIECRGRARRYQTSQRAMANSTETKFGDPATRIAQTDRWTVLLRPRQPTLGSLVLVCREPVKAFSELSLDAFTELRAIVCRCESVLRAVIDYERINYLMLMMVDPDVHFHVIPRYSGTRSFSGMDYPDAGWPGPPAMDVTINPEANARDRLIERLRSAWLRAGN